MQQMNHFMYALVCVPACVWNKMRMDNAHWAWQAIERDGKAFAGVFVMPNKMQILNLYLCTMCSRTQAKSNNTAISNCSVCVSCFHTMFSKGFSKYMFWKWIFSVWYFELPVFTSLFRVANVWRVRYHSMSQSSVSKANGEPKSETARFGYPMIWVEQKRES